MSSFVITSSCGRPLAPSPRPPTAGPGARPRLAALCSLHSLPGVRATSTSLRARPPRGPGSVAQAGRGHAGQQPDHLPCQSHEVLPLSSRTDRPGMVVVPSLVELSTWA